MFSIWGCDFFMIIMIRTCEFPSTIINHTWVSFYYQYFLYINHIFLSQTKCLSDDLQMIVTNYCQTNISLMVLFGSLSSLYVYHYQNNFVLGKTSIEKKRFLSGIGRMMGGGVYPCPNFLALFLEVHFWSIKRVYFFKNANVLNF